MEASFPSLTFVLQGRTPTARRSLWAWARGAVAELLLLAGCRQPSTGRKGLLFAMAGGEEISARFLF